MTVFCKPGSAAPGGGKGGPLLPTTPTPGVVGCCRTLLNTTGAAANIVLMVSDNSCDVTLLQRQIIREFVMISFNNLYVYKFKRKMFGRETKKIKHKNKKHYNTIYKRDYFGSKMIIFLA